MQNSYKQYKWIKALCLFLCIPIVAFCGCKEGTGSSSESNQNSSYQSGSDIDVESSSGEDERPNVDTVNVSLIDSVFYTAEQSAAQVVKGSDYTTTLHILEGYEFLSCDYASYSVQEKEDGAVLLTLHNVRRPSRVSIETARKDASVVPWEIHCSIEYNYNGVIYKGGTSESIDYTLTHHFRPNTWNGQELEREGYVLYGWNTAADGSGEHVGLGSRVTVPENEKITLYAEWAPAIPEGNFSYELRDDGLITLTGYKGKNANVEPFVIPEKIAGYMVADIASSFTMNMRCGKIESKTLVLPKGIKTVHMNAFTNSSFEEIYFFDTLEKVYDGAFPYNLKTYHINAALPPHFVGVNNTTFFADNIDRLILNKDKQKMLLFAGCSFAYGVDSAMLSKHYNDEYVVLNLGVNGDINGAFQLDIILNYIQKGDVFIHAPEQMSQCQLMSSYVVNDYMFIMVEGNYDLLALADFSENDGVFYAFEKYKDVKLSLTPGSYDEGIYQSAYTAYEVVEYRRGEGDWTLFGTQFGYEYVDTNAYFLQMWVQLDFDVIDLTFTKDNVAMVIPVLQSPKDLAADGTPPVITNPEPLEWWQILLAIVALVLIALLIIKLGWKLLWWILCLPFRFIWWLIKLIFKKREDGNAETDY